MTIRQDITATSGASSSDVSRGLAMDIESRLSRKQVADVQTEDLEDNEHMDANESAASPPQAEGKSSDERMFIGNWKLGESEAHNQHLEDNVAGDEYMGLDESMDITTVNEQCVQWDFTNVEMRNQAFRKIVAEKILAKRSASVRQLEIEIDRELESHYTERKMTSCTEPSTHAVCLSHVQVAAR